MRMCNKFRKLKSRRRPVIRLGFLSRYGAAVGISIIPCESVRTWDKFRMLEFRARHVILLEVFSRCCADAIGIPIIPLE